jgi:gluconokinase
MEHPVVVMGVAGSGKSSLAAALARAEDARLVEGDAHHSPANLDKMRRGIALTDADRAGWLDALAAQLRAQPRATVLACSALKRAYRERLRAAAPGLRFVYMEIEPASARARIEARREAHFFSPALVASQFAALESPVGEPGVLRVDALAPLRQLQLEVSAWLREDEQCGA